MYTIHPALRPIDTQILTSIDTSGHFFMELSQYVPCVSLFLFPIPVRGMLNQNEHEHLVYLPVYFQAAKGANTIQSSVDMLAFTILIAPFAVFCGATVELANRYRPQNYLGWSLLVVAYGTFTLLDANSSKAVFVGIQIIMGIGHGLIWVAPQFAVLSPLPESNNAYANSFWLFTRYFAQVCTRTFDLKRHIC